MTATALTYCDFAENDRVFFREAYDNGIRGGRFGPVWEGHLRAVP